MLGELKEDEIQQLLKSNSIGRLGCTDGEHVYITPINYRLEDDSVLCYSLEGHKIDMMRKHPQVCFEVDHINGPDHWRSVIADGVYEEITDMAELNEIRPHYTEYMLRKKVSLTAMPKSENMEEIPVKPLPEQVFYRIRLHKLSGRFETGIF